MTHWDIFTTFEKLLILVGAGSLCLIGGLLIGALYYLIDSALCRRKAKKKQAAQKPIAAIRKRTKATRYDWKGRIY